MRMGGSVLAVGVFDGLHRGHQAILGRAVARARERGLPAGVISFDPHPDVVLSRGPFHPEPPLTPPAQKRDRLLALGVAWLEVVPFTRELAALEPEAFVARHLLEPHGMKCLVVGEDFALGRGRRGDLAYLRALGERDGFQVEGVPLVLEAGRPITSTRVREVLAAGRVAEACRLLGRSYSLAGRVVPGHAVGRRLGFPTANLRLHEEQWLPGDGIYVARVRHAGAWLPGAMSVGTRPTFNGDERTLEVYLLDFEGDLVGAELTVEFLEWVRPQQRFAGPQALARAIRSDVERVREHFAGAKHPP